MKKKNKKKGRKKEDGGSGNHGGCLGFLEDIVDGFFSIFFFWVDF